MNKQSGFAPILILLAAAAVIIYLLVSSTFPFKDKLFSLLYPKPPSHAQESAPSVPDEILLKFKPGVDEKSKNNIRKHFGIKKEDEITQIGVEIGKVPEKAKDKIIEALKKNPRVEYAEPNFIVKAQLSPNDYYFSIRTWWWWKISAPSAWDISIGTPSAIIAILDTGIELNHEDLIGKYLDSPLADDHGHGTIVAGVAAAHANNGIGVASVCWLCPILSFKVLTSTGSGTNWALDQAIPAATDQGAKVINMSLGSYTYTQDVQDATNYAWSKGVVVVAAAGNDSTSNLFYPAADNNTIAVANSTGSDTLDTTSNFGPWVDVAAPGSGITSTAMGGGYQPASGTSISSPFVAGLAGLIFSANPSLTNQQVVDIIISTADLVPAGKRINAYAALQKATGITPSPTPSPSPSPTPTPSPSPSDTTPPQVSVSSPSDGSTVSGTSVNVQASASDNVSVSSVAIFIDNNLVNICSTSSSSSSCSYSWDTTKETNSSHTIYASALDSSNNQASSSTITVNVSNITPTPTPVPSDTTPPTVSITSPVDGSNVKAGSKVNITANASDSGGISKVEFYVNSSLKCTDTTSPYSCSWSVPGKKNNIQYTIYAKAYDKATPTPNNSQSVSIKVVAQ